MSNFSVVLGLSYPPMRIVPDGEAQLLCILPRRILSRYITYYIYYIMYNIRYCFQQPTWDALGWRSFSTHLVQKSSSARTWNHTNHHTRLTPPLNGPTRALTQAGQAASNGDLWMVQKPPQGSEKLLCNQHWSHQRLQQLDRTNFYILSIM